MISENPHSFLMSFLQYETTWRRWWHQSQGRGSRAPRPCHLTMSCCCCCCCCRPNTGSSCCFRCCCQQEIIFPFKNLGFEARTAKKPTSVSCTIKIQQYPASILVILCSFFSKNRVWDLVIKVVALWCKDFVMRSLTVRVKWCEKDDYQFFPTQHVTINAHFRRLL